MFIGPLKKAIVHIIANNSGCSVRFGHRQAGQPDTIGHAVTLIKVIAADDIVGSAEDGEMAKLRGPVFAQLDIIAIGIDCNADAVLGFGIWLSRYKMTAIHQHALTGGPDGVQPAVLEPRDETILNMKNISRTRQHDTAGFAVALKFNVLQREL